MSTYRWTMDEQGNVTEWLREERTVFGWPGWLEQNKGEDGEVVTDAELEAKGPVFDHSPTTDDFAEQRARTQVNLMLWGMRPVDFPTTWVELQEMLDEARSEGYGEGSSDGYSSGYEAATDND